MASNMDVKRAEIELIRVRAARAELEFKILEREEDIERIKQHVQVQLDKEVELESKIRALKGE